MPPTNLKKAPFGLRDSTLWVQLGRFGDIINILPLLYEESRRGVKPELMVAQPYLSLLEGVSYVRPVVWHGQFPDLRGALGSVQGKYQQLKITQVYAWQMAFAHTTDSFLKESWARVGRVADWGKLPLVFDKRDWNRERMLKDRFVGKKPLVLVAANGISSPFAYGPALLELLRSELGQEYDVLDLSNVQATRFYDLLGLFDAAKALVVIDTAHMHLARASKVPVVALVTDGPTPWHTSAPMEGQILRMKYSEFPTRQVEIVQAIKTLKDRRFYSLPRAKVGSSLRTGRKLFHVYSDYPRSGEALHRHEFARMTWENEARNQAWVDWPVKQEQLLRTSKSVFGDSREMPFIKDLIGNVVERSGAAPDDLIVLTNDDIAFVQGIGEWLLEVSSQRAAWSNRWDFRELSGMLGTEQVRTGCWCVGTDLFAFTPAWWRLYEPQFPDMVLGCEAWDWVMRDLIRDSGGFELHAMIYHESHFSFWQRGNNRRANPGNRWNQQLAKEWLLYRGKALRELAQV